MKIKEKENNNILEDDLELEDLDISEEFHENHDDLYDEEKEHHKKLSMILHFFMAMAAIVIVVVIVSVLMIQNNPIVYNDIDASGITVSGVYQSIVERDEDEDGVNTAENHVENKVSITVLTQDSDVPTVLLEGVLTQMHGMDVCFSKDSSRGYYAACFTSGNTTYLLETEEINKKQFTKAVEQFIKDQY